MKKVTEKFSQINPFDFSVSYIEIDSNSPENVYDDHIHDECEIYINLSGDVSFSVEGTIYPIMPGGVIITRPSEYHHCIYHSNKLHKHFWILFNPSGNDRLFNIFFNRKLGRNNLLILHHDETEELFSVCRNLNCPNNDCAEKYYLFFKLIHLLNKASAVKVEKQYKKNTVTAAINYINSNLSQRLEIKEIAKICNVSINTLERQFIHSLNITPSKYIRKKRLANAAQLLSEGCNVTESAQLSGFSDTSSFIEFFKKHYNITPLKYKNLHNALNSPYL